MYPVAIYDLPADDGTPVKYEFALPSSWLEATREHLLAITRALLSKKDPVKIKFTLLKELAGIPAKLMHRMPPADHFIKEVDATDFNTPWRPVPKTEMRMLPELDWAFTPANFTDSLLPSIEHAGITWTGPSNSFERMTLNQWLFCTTLLTNFRKEKDPATANTILNNLMGAMYQPAHATWTNEPIEEYGVRLADLPPEVKLAAVLNYEAIHSAVVKHYWRVFNPNNNADPSPQGLFSLAHDAAKSGAFVNYGEGDRVEDKPLLLILGYMEHSLFSDEQQAARAKQLAEETKNANG
ncbi:MAG TPA: hypothetical protein PLB89_04675 [Flavobacteriales bacterium]|nr:hypothetical protein [Flavobacteriales bacterium]